MRKVLPLIWCWLALGSILWGVQVLVAANTVWAVDPDSPIALTSSVVLAGLATWLISRRNIEAWARWLGVFYIALIVASGAALFVFFAQVGLNGFVRPWIAWGCGIAFLMGLAAGVLIGRKGILRGVAVAAAILVLAFGLIVLLAQRQKSIIRDYEQQWESMGWAMDLESVYPMPYSKPQCQAWFDAMAVISPRSEGGKGKRDWKPFYDETVVPLCSDTLIETLQKGQDLRAVVLAHPAASDPRWPEYRAVDAAVRTAMEQCPHVQWFEPVEYKDRLLEAPIPNLLGMMKWTRGAIAQSQIAAANGRFDEARTNLDAVHRGAGKMLIKGQILIGTLIGIAMEKLSLVGHAGVMAMGGGPLPVETRKRIEQSALQDMDWYEASLKGELKAFCSALKNAEEQQFGKMDFALHRWIPMKSMIFRALYVGETDNYLFNMTQTIQRKIDGYNREAQQFGWAMYKHLKAKESQISFNLSASYGRALSLLAQARLVLMMDEVLKYRQEHKALPEDLDSVQAPWRVDPFDEKPLRYKKEGENLFVVWSVGPDGRDDGAQNLYVSRAMDMKDELKEDIGFRVLLPPLGRS
jgi:hypothetical protein